WRRRSASARDLAGRGGVAPWCTERGVSFGTTAWCTSARKHAPAERTHNPDGRNLRGEPDAGNPPVRFDVAGAGDGVMESPKRARSRKRQTQPRGVLHTTAPVPDPTGQNRKHGCRCRHGDEIRNARGTSLRGRVVVRHGWSDLTQSWILSKCVRTHRLPLCLRRREAQPRRDKLWRSCAEVLCCCVVAVTAVGRYEGSHDVVILGRQLYCPFQCRHGWLYEMGLECGEAQA